MDTNTEMTEMLEGPNENFKVAIILNNKQLSQQAVINMLKQFFKNLSAKK